MRAHVVLVRLRRSSRAVSARAEEPGVRARVRERNSRAHLLSTRELATPPFSFVVNKSLNRGISRLFLFRLHLRAQIATVSHEYMYYLVRRSCSRQALLSDVFF